MSHTLLFAASANALLRYRTCGSFPLASPVLTFAPSLDVRGRIARERVPTSRKSLHRSPNLYPTSRLDSGPRRVTIGSRLPSHRNSKWADGRTLVTSFGRKQAMH